MLSYTISKASCTIRNRFPRVFQPEKQPHPYILEREGEAETPVIDGEEGAAGNDAERLKREALLPEHLDTHLPMNPYGWTCQRASARHKQQREARNKKHEIVLPPKPRGSGASTLAINGSR